MANDFDWRDLFSDGEEVTFEIVYDPKVLLRCSGWERVPHDVEEITGLAIYIYGKNELQETFLYCNDCNERFKEDGE